jgi:hypothetical protein
MTPGLFAAHTRPRPRHDSVRQIGREVVGYRR